jgi:predicted ATP-dependent endonuclease of OLD family
MLRLVPIIKTKIHPSKLIFSIEEPENNLHPALLRRLLTYLAAKREELGFTLFLTTHSPICIDWSSKRNDSQIIHVKHDGKSATSHPAINYLQGRDILDDLDIRASDILQANGVIWVEGPSDRIYLRRWIELVSNGELKEGVHYTIMFYGGRLLSHLDALPLEESEELISLLRINRNAAVVIDSDRQPKKVGKHKPRMNLNKTKIRVRDEIEAIGGFAWITEGREIENYTPLHVFARITGKPAPKTIDQYTKLPDHPFLSEFKKDKVAIAHAAAPATELNDIDSHLDLRNQLERLCAQIRDWNGLN